MVTYIRSDLDFILAQIKISEAHSAGQPLFGPGGLIPAYNIAWGLRTVDGSYNHLLPGQEQWGAAGAEFPELLPPVYRPADGTLFDPDGPMGPAPAMPTAANYNPSNNPNSLVFDSSLRTISNLLVDQTLGNPAAILTALERAGSENPMLDLPAVTAIYQTFKPAWDAEYQARVVMQNAKTAVDAAVLGADGDPATPLSPAEQQTLDDAIAALAAATTAHGDTVTALEAARVVRDTALEPFGIAMQGDNVHLPAVAPDEGLSAPFNSWFTLFGQFFDHGLDLINKGGSGTVFIPLQPDDPLYVEGSHTNFMVLTRATVSAGPDNVMGTPDDVRPVNTTTSFVDQNQTYTSHASHQVFLRQYDNNGPGTAPFATGKLIEGANGGMATWGEVKAQARTLLGINLTDADVGAVPLLRTDPYGNFIPGANGFPQVILGVGADGIPNTADDVVLEGNPAANGNTGISTAGAIRTASAFLADIAHEAVPIGKIADGDITIGLGNPGNGDTEYDNELLDAHFIAGDGRANENIGLIAVHHVFHAEHNRLVEHTKETVLASNDLAFINEWLAVDVGAVPATPAEIEALVWDGERLFQAAKFGTEMQYQHLVFEEFARKVQPNINVFLVPDGFDTTMDPSIVAEFAHVVYRFGHSMLTESIDRFDPSFNADHIGLIQGFLNPLAFDGGPTGVAHSITDDIAAGAIIRGMTRQVGNEIDEFVTTALRNNLLGLPLDLATINLARGRDTGVPSLNAARRSFYEATNEDVLLKPYESWVDFAGHLKHEASIINFIAAYGTHTLITGATTLQEKRDAALTIITGVSTGGFAVPADRLDFLNATNAYAGGSLGGLENVDLWIGGLAEEIMPFGGMLGSTFNFVFEVQMEKLQSGDRFYYLQRLDGLHLFGEMENNSFAAMIMRNTDATHLPSDVFSTPGLILEVDRTRQYNPGLAEDAGEDGILEDDPGTAVNESADNRGADPVGTSLLTPLVIRDNPATPGVDTNYLRYTGGDHVVLGGTDAADTLIAGIGDDTLYGDGGNDVLEGGFGNDIINAGDGDDIIKDSGGDDNIKAGKGHDVVHAGPGLDLVMGNDGQDFIFLGTDMGSEVFAGTGNDFIYGNKNAERILGNEGDDWIETGTFDGAPGDNFDEIFAQDGIDGHDVFLGDGGFDEFIAEGGDDIMVGSPGRGKMAGMSGFDWVTYKDNTLAVDADLTRGIVFDENPTPPPNATLDAYEGVEGLSGSSKNDLLTGSDITAAERLPFAQGGSEGYRGSQLTKEGLALIAGLREVLGLSEAQVNALVAGAVVYSAGEIILGGDGSDTIMGRGGDDIIDGDKWLDVNIAVMSEVGPDGGVGTILETHKSMTTLAAKMFNGTYNPGQLRIIREIKTDTTAGDIDIAKYQGNRSEYAFAGNADGSIQVTHTIEDQLDGSDKVRNVERLQFLDSTMGIVVGTNGPDVLNGSEQDDLILGLDGADVLNGNGGNDILVGGPNTNTSGSASDDFNTQTLTGGTGWASAWTEDGDNGNTSSASQGQIRIDNNNSNTLQFRDDDTDANAGTAAIQRTINLAGATTATITFTYNEVSFDAGEQVVVEFSPNGSAPFQLIETINGNSGNGGVTNFPLTGAFTATAVLRFTVSGTNANSGGGDAVSIDGLVINYASSEVLNGGAGDDTYIYNPGDGNDIINELANGGAADRLSIVSTAIDPVTLLPVLTGLNAQDDNGGTANGNLIITANGGTINVAGHFTGGNAQTGIERINFNNATFAGYLLGADDYVVGRADPGNRDGGGVNLSASLANNFIVGEQGTNDVITGGSGNDLIFGATGDNDLFGGAGDDLLVGGSGAGDDDFLDGGLDADTMVGLAGNDVYVVDDVADVVVEALNAGTDRVETEMAALSIELMANVENLEYTGIDADQFVGTGNALNNVITGGDLDDTLSGLGGNDTLNGGLGNDSLTGGIGADTLNGGAGADNMIGGADNDIYVVDDAGDVVTEVAAGGTDRVDSSITYVLGAEVENLNLTGGDAINGTGNALANTINGNDDNNQLFGGAGNDTINGNDGNDLIDGGLGNDTISGGDDNDTIIGNAGDDTIDVGGGFNTIVYNTPNFGNDTINSFDAAGGAPTNQDRIDLSALGITSANFATRVIETAAGGNTQLSIRDASGTVEIGRILVNGVTTANMEITDFTLATASTVLPGATTGNNTLTGTAGNDIINALAGNDTVNAGAGNDTITGGLNGTGGPGADVLNGDAGDDTFIWNANNAAANSLTNSDGRDQINGGTEGGVGDTFVINGGAASEAYTIYTLAAWDAIAGNALGSFNGRTPEIVITRGGSAFANVIAELSEIEEIRINGVDPAGASGGAGPGDTFTVVGDFSGTSLRLNTITIDGHSGDDTVDISALNSAHRIVFRSNGGNDTILGTLRPQDVIELPDGAVPGDYEVVTDENGVTTMTSPTHSICFTSEGGMPQFGSGGHDDDDDDDHGPGDDDDDDDDDHHGGNDDDDDDDGPGTPAPNPSTGNLKVGTAQTDVLMGTAAADDIIGLAGDDVVVGGDGEDNIAAGEGNDFVNAGNGVDIVFAGSGDDVVFGGQGGDVIYGEAGDDRILGGTGDDVIDAGAGNDTVFAGSDNDLIIGSVGDGDDTYFGDDSDVGGSGGGVDTLDLSAITANLTVDLGSGLLGRGSASSTQSGNDTLWNIENVATGSGDDTITASNAENVIEGGAGNDTFRFLSAEAAAGDTILGFEPGDRLDLSGIDADSAQAGNQSFTLVNGPITAAGQVAVTYEVRVDGEYTIISGSTDANTDEEFRIDLKGNHTLNGGNFNL